MVQPSSPIPILGGHIDLQARQIHRDGEVFRLTSTEHRLLGWMVERPETLLTTEDLLVEVWGMRATTRTRAVSHAVQRLRQKLERDSSQPQHLLTEHGDGYRWLPGVTPVPQSAPAPQPSRPSHNLPEYRDDFFGRTEELAQLQERIERGERLITILGMGGLGKTRLAVQLAESIQATVSGCWMVDCAAARDAEGITLALGHALQTPLKATPVPQLGDVLRAHGSVVVIFDNMEALIPHVSETLGRWLTLAPEATFIATSRRRLGLSGELLFPLSPLSAEDATALFYSRARMFRPSLEETPENTDLISTIVVQLDRLAHAVELAAARTRHMGLQHICQRLPQRLDLLCSGWSDRSKRHQTLRSMIDWSWQLLEPWEQAVLAQASVFAGGFTLESAEAVLAPPQPDAPMVIDILFSLLDQSLLQVDYRDDGTERYHLLESVRVFAAEQRSSPELADRHARHFARLSERMAIQARGRQDWQSWQALVVELDNLGAALTHSLARQDGETAGACALSASEVLLRTGPIQRSTAWLDRALSIPQPREQRARIRGLRSHNRRLQGDHSGALEDARAALDTTDPRAKITALTALGKLLQEQGESDEALRCNEEALLTAQHAGLPNFEAAARTMLGYQSRLRGELDAAMAHYQAAMALYQATGQHYRLGDMLQRIGLIHDMRGELDVALDTLEQSIAIHRQNGNQRQVGIGLGNLGLAFFHAGDLATARTHYEEGLGILRRLESHRNAMLVAGNLGALCVEERRWPEADAHLEYCIVHADRIMPPAAAFFRGVLALSCAQQGQTERAHRLLKRAVSARSQLPHAQQVEGLCHQARTLHTLGDARGAQEAIAAAEELARPVGGRLLKTITDARAHLSTPLRLLQG